MKRIILFLLWLVVLFLLVLFIVQRVTGKPVNGEVLRVRVDKEVAIIQDRVRAIVGGGEQSGQNTETQVTTNKTLSGSADTIRLMELSGMKADIARNRAFFVNLTKDILKTQTSVGKGDIFVQWKGITDGSEDTIEATISGSVVVYPAKYNADNAFALQNGFASNVYRAQGLQLIISDTIPYVYYPAYNSSGGLKGVIMSLSQGNGIIMDNLIPVLYYKDRYIYTIQESQGSRSLFVPSGADLQTIAAGLIGGIAIDASLFAFHDMTANKLYFLSLDDLKVVKEIDIIKTGITFWGFVKKDDVVRIAYQDNLRNKYVYEKYKR